MRHPTTRNDLVDPRNFVSSAGVETWLKSVRVKNRLLRIPYILMVIALTALGWVAYSSSLDHERKSEELTRELHTVPKMKGLGRRTLEIMTFGAYEGYNKEMKSKKDLVAAIETHNRRAVFATVSFFVLLVIFLGSVYGISRNRQIFVLSFLLVSSIALVVGLLAPMLTIVAHKNMPILGNVVFQFQSKGIFSTIAKLFSSGNILVALPLLLFSVIVPILKTFTMALASVSSSRTITHGSLDLIKCIGKWSMADVFVVALFLAYFAMDKSEFTDAETQIGLYFFLGYVILSNIASHILSHEGLRKPQTFFPPSQTQSRQTHQTEESPRQPSGIVS